MSRRRPSLYTNLQVVRFRTLEKHKEDAFCLELSNTLTCRDVMERVASHLGLDDTKKIRFTSHNHYVDQPKPQPDCFGGNHLYDMLGNYQKRSDVLYYEVLDASLSRCSYEKTLNVAFHHATNADVMIHSITLKKHSTVGDLLDDLKTRVELSHPDAELRLLELINNKICKIYPLSDKISNINIQYWTLRAEEIPEEEKNRGPHDCLIHVCHVMTPSRNYGIRYPGEPFFLVIHEKEILAAIKVRIQKKLQVLDDEFSKWKFVVGFKYLQDSDIVYSHLRESGDFCGGGWEYQYLGLEHSDSAPNRAYAANEDEDLVPHSEYVEGPEPKEVALAEMITTVKSEPVKDPLSTRFTWVIENFSSLNTKRHYSDIFLAGCYKWQVMIFPRGNNVDHLSMYLNIMDSTNFPYAEFSLVVVNQIHEAYTVRKDTQQQFTTEQSSWGFASFMPLNELTNPVRGYVVNDNCIVEAEVLVRRPIKKQKVVAPMVMENSRYDSQKSRALTGKSKEAIPQAGVFVKVEVLPEPETQTKLDGQINEPLVVVEEASIEVPLAEQVPEPATPNEVMAPVPPTQSGEMAPILEYPGAGQLFEEGQHRQDALDDKYEDVGGFSILKTQASLYKQIWLKYGHIATSQVLTASYSGQVTLVTDIMHSIMDMHDLRLHEVSPKMIELWEKKIKMAEKLEFNIRWLRKRFEGVKHDFYWEQELKTTILAKQDKCIQVAEARLIAAEDELKKAREDLCTLQTERQIYVEKSSLLLFDGLF